MVLVLGVAGTSQARDGATPIAGCPAIVSVRIEKAARQLTVECSDGTRQHLRVGLGREPIGAKRRRGDQRTPEGRYHVAEAPRASQYHRFIALDYPAVEDAERALAEGRIDRALHRRIVDAHRAGTLPPQDTALGGHVGIHGEGYVWSGTSSFLDWTLGCIALSDVDVEFLAARLAPGVPVSITP